MLREVRLYGALGERFGRVHHLAVANAAEAVRALSANDEEFERYLRESDGYYRVFAGRDDVATHEKLHLNCSPDKIIRIAPVIQGAKRGGFFSILAGAALVAFSIWNPAFAATALWGTTTVGSLAGSIGFSLILGGVSQLLTSPPKSNAPSERPENTPSYVFDGAVNTTAQGQPVPIGYGRMIVGSARISGGILVEDMAV